MSTSAVSGSSLNQQIQQYFQTRKSDLQQLGQALGAGDVAGAQTAFNNIVSLGQSGPFKSGNPFVINQREQDFTNIGKALQSGDLAGAQHAFATLGGTFGGAKQLDPPPTTSPTPGASNEQIVVNLLDGSSSTGSSSSGASSSSSLSVSA